MTDPDELDRYRLPALDKGLDILELLAGEEEGLSQAEIAKAPGRTPNEHYRMLERLVRRGYVSRNASDRYELTLKLFGLAFPSADPPAGVAGDSAGCGRSRPARCSTLAVYDRAGVNVIAQMDAPGWSASPSGSRRVSTSSTRDPATCSWRSARPKAGR